MSKFRPLLTLLILFLCMGIGSDFLSAQEATPPPQSLAPPPPMLGPVQAPSMIQELTAVTALSLLPFAIMLLTSYIKIVVVLSLLRNALGVQQSPPNQVLTGIALLMTIYVMFPTGLAMYNAAEGV